MIRSVGDSLERLPAGGGSSRQPQQPSRRTAPERMPSARPPPDESLGKGEGPGGEPVRGLPALPKGSPRHVSPNLPPRLPRNEPVLQLVVFFHDKVVEPGDVDVRAGWIALYSGMAGGGDVILIPEIPYNIHRIGETILNRLKKGKPYSIVVVAEGIQTDGRKRAAEYIAQEIEYETGIETRETVLGYIQRGGSPTPFDRNLSTRMGGHATELIANGQFGRMITLKGNEIASAPLEEIAGKLKLVTEDNDLVVQGRRMGICFG